MPEAPFEKIKPHPIRGASADTAGVRAPAACAYAELAVTSNYTFLTGASHPEEMVERAAALGHSGAAIADRNTLAGVVRAHVAAKKVGIPLAVGCRLAFVEPAEVTALVFATSRESYARLSRLLTLGKRRAPKGECYLTPGDLFEHHEGLLCALAPGASVDDGLERTLRDFAVVFDDDRLSIAAWRTFSAGDDERLAAVAELSRRTGTPMVAVNDAHYHDPSRRALQDVLTCIRHGCTVHDAGYRLQCSAERHLKSPDEMARLFAEYPGATDRAAQIVERASAFSLDQLKYDYPHEVCPPGMTPIEHLTACAWAGAAERYPSGVPEKVRASLRHELALIEELKYEAYFLTCYDIVRYARGRGILCQGRGGAANSTVCYCLGITEVDPSRFSLLFERFVSRARNEPPDIDIDFEHERREEVIQYLYEKYGRERAALTAEVISYRGRSAVRDVGKAMGLSQDCVDALARHLDRWHEPPDPDRVREAGMNPDDPTVRRVIELSREICGFPRHLSQHVGGFVITRSPLCELVPIENASMEDRTVIEWDKDDIDAMNMLKVDVLGLGMLTCIRKAFALAQESDAVCGVARAHTIPATPREDPAVYAMIQRADTVGVFQIESRAQMSMLPRLKPREFYDLVIEVAIVRPGPIQGGMVHPYLRRRSGQERPWYPSPEVEQVLGRTLGVPLFQEQAMQLAIVAAGFTPDEADALRRAMAAWKRKGDQIYRFGQKLVGGMIASGYPRDFAERCFEQIKGFSEYGFPESHAASFALLVYISCWLKRRRPAAFAAALINSQPMGFYQPAQIIRDAHEHGVDVRPVDVNHSAWDCTLEHADRPTPPIDEGDDAPAEWGKKGPAIRLGMRMVKGLSRADADAIVRAVREKGRFESVRALWRASGAGAGALRRLARADAFGSMNLDRQAALWQITPLRDEALPLFDQAVPRDDDAADLPEVAPSRQVLLDYEHTGLSLKAHPVAFLRPYLESRGAITNQTLRDAARCPQGREVIVAGAVLVRQRPGTASGVVFITLEDETGIVNLVVWSTTFERYRAVARLSTVLLVRGRVERAGEVVHVHAMHLESLDAKIPELESVSRDFH